MKAYIKMETKHRPSTDDDGVKQCFALPKITSKRVPEGVYEESIGMSGWILIELNNWYNKLPDELFFPVENGGSS